MPPSDREIRRPLRKGKGITIGATVHPTAVVEQGARLAEGVAVGPYCVIGQNVEIGARTRLANGVTVQGNTVIGCDNVISPYVVIGTAPQDLKFQGGSTRVVVGDRNTIREYVTINVGTERGGGITTVGSDNYLMCACHIAHDCHVGDGCVISNVVLLAGHIHIGSRAVLSGAVAIHHFASVGEYAFIGGLSRVVHDVPPFLISEGNPAEARTVNVVGLRRGGFSPERIAALESAFKLLFRSGAPISSTLQKLESEAPTPDVVRLVAFLKARGAGKHGRANQP